MRILFLVLFAFVASLSYGQKTVVQANIVKAKDEFFLKTQRITDIITDTSFIAASNLKLPTQLAVKKYVDSRIGGRAYDASIPPTTGYVIKWDGTKWKPDVDGGGGGGGASVGIFPTAVNADTISLVKTGAEIGDVIRYNGSEWEFGSPVFDEKWYDFQALTTGNTYSTLFATSAESANNFLIVSGTAGDTVLTIVSGTASLFNANFGAVVRDKVNNRYYPVLVLSAGSGLVKVGQPLPFSFSSDTLKVVAEVQNGQHFSLYGYRALADEMVYRKRYLCDRTKYIAAFMPERYGYSTTIPFEFYGGYSTGGFVPGSSNTMFNQATVALEIINTSNQYRYKFQFDQGGAAGKGFKWKVNTGQHKGHLNFLISVSNTGTALPPSAIVRLRRFSTNTVIEQKTITGAGIQEVDFVFENEDDLVFECETATSNPTSIRLNRLVWNYRTEDNLSKNLFDDATKIVFYGDSWTVYNDSAIVKELRTKLPGKTIISKGRGGMTVKWGGRYIRQEIVNMTPKPSHVVINFRINDFNSIGSGSTAWNFSSTGAYAAGTDVFGGVSGGKEWQDSIETMKRLLLDNNITPVFLFDHHTQSVGQQLGQMDTLSGYWYPPKYYSTGKLIVSEQMLATQAIIPRITSDTLSSTANSFNRLWGRSNGVDQPSMTITTIDPNAGGAKSILIKPIVNRTAGNALQINSFSGYPLHKFKWGDATSTYSTGNIESGSFISNYPFSGGGFRITNGMYMEMSGGVGTFGTSILQSRLDIGSTGTGYNSIYFNQVGTGTTDGFRFYTGSSLRAFLSKDGRLAIGNNLSPSEALDVTGNVRISGAFMPNNLPGSPGQALLSAGTGVAPTWGTITPNANLDQAYNNFGASAAIIVVDNAEGQGDMRINLPSTHDFLIQDNGTTYATFDDSGNIGFGTASNTNQRLIVNRSGSGTQVPLRVNNGIDEDASATQISFALAGVDRFSIVSSDPAGSYLNQTAFNFYNGSSMEPGISFHGDYKGIKMENALYKEIDNQTSTSVILDGRTSVVYVPSAATTTSITLPEIVSGVIGSNQVGVGFEVLVVIHRSVAVTVNRSGSDDLILTNDVNHSGGLSTSLSSAANVGFVRRFTAIGSDVWAVE